MSIHMIGIDYHHATVDERAIFSLTKTKSIEAMRCFSAKPSVLGCVILSTCNRLEIWAEMQGTVDNDLYQSLCEFKQIDPQQFAQCVITRQDSDAVAHLFELACGLKSQILGEEQILTQVKQALVVARENGFANSTLEVLFRTAITTAKQVKTKGLLSKKNTSAIDQAILRLQQNGLSLQHKTCMVIGNGQMGQFATEALLAQQATVYVTVRPYRHGNVQVPPGAIPILYDARQDYISMCDVIVSATSSPHLTLTASMLPIDRCPILIDLAVPRDIDPACKQRDDLCLYDIDDFKVCNTATNEAIEQVQAIIKQEMPVFFDWQCGSSLVSKIQMIKQEAAADVHARLKKRLQTVGMTQTQCLEVEHEIDIATQNMLNKMLFELKNQLDPQAFAVCIEGLEKIYE